MYTCRVAVVLTCLSACGIGGGVQAYHTSLPGDAGDSVNLIAKSITIWDATGILLGAVGTAGNRHLARTRAQEQAIREGKQAGDSYSYEYQVIPPAPGNWTVFTYSWGDGTGAQDQAVDFWEFDMRTQLGNWRVGRVGLSVQLGATFAKYKELKSYETTGGHDDFNVVCMPTGLVGAFKVGPAGTFTGRVVIDPVISGILLAVDRPWYMYEFGARLDYRVLKKFNLYADAARRRSAIDGYIDETIASVGVGYIWGEDRLKMLKQ